VNGSNGNNQHSIEAPSAGPDTEDTALPASELSKDGSPSETATIATRGGQKKRNVEQKQIVIMAAGGIIVAILAFVLVSVPRMQRTPKPKSPASSQNDASSGAGAASGSSSVLVTESGAVRGTGDHNEQLREQDVQRTAAPSRAKTNPVRAAAAQEPTPGTTLGTIPPFDSDHDWQAPPYNPTSPNGIETPDSLKSERDLLEKPSMVFVHSPASVNSASRAEHTQPTVGLGLSTGTRLRARLETVATSAVKLPAIAIIEYNYERNGQILIPAGAKALGRVEQADRTGFMSIRFDTLLMPNGTEVPFDAVATDLRLAPLRGKVQGKNTGKSILARSLSGVGEAGALFAGRGSLNQPFSEQDLIRERVATNIGEESDREVNHLAIAEHIVVSVPAGTPIYVVLQQTTKQAMPTPSTVSSAAANAQNQELMQLFQKQLSGPPVSAGHTEQ
jgi:hypothetical protein